jgi:hypothetical protein
MRVPAMWDAARRVGRLYDLRLDRLRPVDGH